MENRMTQFCQVDAFGRYLQQEERSSSTIEKYLRDIRAFVVRLEGKTLTKESVCAWKEALLAQGYAPATINTMVAAINQFLSFLGWDDCRVKSLRLQRKLFRDDRRELSRNEYAHLVQTAQTLGRERLALLMEAICATGIRVSELRFFTVEAALQGMTQIRLKGKIRTILLPAKLCRKLLKYAKKQKITSGEIFLTRGGKRLSRKQIWAEMKSLCPKAGIAPGKVFPHNLRHLFAKTFYTAQKDIVTLADLLGHSSIETTRIYLLSSGREQQRLLDRLQLVC